MKKITLNQNNFKHFFSPVGPLHSHHEEHIWPYDYVDRGSDTLLVTIGDSWTWGTGLCDFNPTATNITAEQNDFRLNHLYGNLISKERNWNWMNLGFYAMGNQWMANKVFELRALSPLLEFKEIIVMVNFTATGSWFNTFQDSLTDYKTFFNTNKMTAVEEYENFLFELNRKLVKDIILLTKSEKRIKLLVGTNSVDHCGFDLLQEEQVIPIPWYSLLTDTKLNGTFVNVDSIKYLPSMEKFLDNKQKFAFKEWMIQKIDQAEKQTAMTKTMQDVTPDGFHPNHNGHRKWAEYILHEVIK